MLAFMPHIINMVFEPIGGSLILQISLSIFKELWQKHWRSVLLFIYCLFVFN